LAQPYLGGEKEVRGEEKEKEIQKRMNGVVRGEREKRKRVRWESITTPRRKHASAPDAPSNVHDVSPVL
jgi:hypothetical protein